MKIFNTDIYGLQESIVRSGYPMLTEVAETLPSAFSYEIEQDKKRALKLGNSQVGSGHDCFLKGIIVQADIEAPAYWWPQWQRYHFADIISSQSKMHQLVNMNIASACHEYVEPDALAVTLYRLEEYKNNPTDENFERLLANTPQGLELTAAITTSYLQLKTMYYQRRHHRLKMWNTVFVRWVMALPLFHQLCINSAINGREEDE
jgi:hypothetical protein